MKKFKFIHLLLILLISARISKAESTDTTGVFLTLENELTYMYGTPSIDAESVNYRDEKKHSHSIKMRKMKWMIVGSRVFCSFPIKQNDKMYRLMEVIAMNKDYILMSYWQTTSYLYVYDYKSTLIEGKIPIYASGVGSKKHNRKALEQITPYFESCKSLMELFNTNLANEKLLIKDLYVYQCKGAPDVEDFISKYKDKRITEE